MVQQVTLIAVSALIGNIEKNFTGKIFKDSNGIDYLQLVCQASGSNDQLIDIPLEVFEILYKVVPSNTGRDNNAMV